MDWIPLLALLLTVEEVLLLSWAWRQRDRRWIILPVLWRAPLSIYMLYGLWYCVVSRDYSLGADPYPLAWWRFGIVIEIVFVAFFGLAAALAASALKKHQPSDTPWHTLSRQRHGDTAVWLLMIVSLLANRVLAAEGLIYAEASGNLVTDMAGFGGRWNSLLVPVAAFYWPSLAALFVERLSGFEGRPGSRIKRRCFDIVVVPIALYVYLDVLLQGQRAAALLPFIMIALSVLLHNVTFARLAVMSGAGLAMVLAIGGLLSVYRSNRSTLDAPVAERAQALLSTHETMESQGHSTLTTLKRLAGRADWYKGGGALAMFSEYHGFAGWRPYQGLLYALVPRRFAPGKPLISSMDGTYRGYPAYILGWWRKGGNRYAGASAGRSVAGDAYWQFGWLGVIVTAAVTGWWLMVCSHSFLSRPMSLGFLFFLATIPSAGSATLERVLYFQVLRGLIVYWICCQLILIVQHVGGRSHMLPGSDLVSVSRFHPSDRTGSRYSGGEIVPHWQPLQAPRFTGERRTSRKWL